MLSISSLVWSSRRPLLTAEMLRRLSTLREERLWQSRRRRRPTKRAQSQWGKWMVGMSWSLLWLLMAMTAWSVSRSSRGSRAATARNLRAGLRWTWICILSIGWWIVCLVYAISYAIQIPCSTVFITYTKLDKSHLTNTRHHAYCF